MYFLENVENRSIFLIVICFRGDGGRGRSFVFSSGEDFRGEEKRFGIF